MTAATSRSGKPITPKERPRGENVDLMDALRKSVGGAATLLVDEVDQRSFVLVFEFAGFERAGLLLDDVPGEVEHVLGDFDVLDLVEIFGRIADFVWIAQQGADQPLVHRLQSNDVLAVGQHQASDRDLVHLTDGLADHREGVVADLAVRTQILGTDQISGIDLAAVDELVDLDGPGRFQRHVLDLFLGDLDEGVASTL
jgi:hypothetical protein